ncbi:MAG TPA: TetR-like C-terminal domain-containing protein, partial [Polyangiaceae bacterium]|nr:TetR-like C-terminal domain-containing protein [Polyangiaceae bacterium]
FGDGCELVAEDAELGEEGGGAFRALEGALVFLQTRGLVRADDVQTQANFVWSVVHGVAMLSIGGSFERASVDVSSLSRYAVQQLISGIGSR